MNPLTLDEIRAIPAHTEVFLESKSPAYTADFPIILCCRDSHFAYFKDPRGMTFSKAFAKYDMMDNILGWRILSEKPSLDKKTQS